MRSSMRASRTLMASVSFFAMAALLLAGQPTASLRRDASLNQGMSLEGRPLLYAPGVVSPGSSVSHWDVSATPNLLMEPFINFDLPFGGLDMTPDLMSDIGWTEGTSSLNILDLDEEGTGFTDPRPFAGAPGNPATTLGEARQNLIAGVLDAWALTLQSPVEIDVEVTWQPLFCAEEVGATLAGASSTVVFLDPGGTLFPERNVWYPSALAEALFEDNLSGDPNDESGSADIFVVINSDVDEGCLGEDSAFYYGLDGEEPANRIDIAAVILHELAHGLGFANFTEETTGAFLADRPGIFDVFTYDETLGRSWSQMGPTERSGSATNDKNLSWWGDQARATASSLLEPGTPLIQIEDETLIVTPANFGAELTSEGVEADLACAFDSSSEVSGFPALPSIRDACSPIQNIAEVSGRLAIVDRGNCSFTSKALNLQEAGAVGALIVNSQDSALAPGGDNGALITIPVVGLSRSQGSVLRGIACPIAPPANLIFAQWVDGEAAGQENSVRLILQNPSAQTDTGLIVFRTPDGGPSDSTGSRLRQSSEIPFEITPRGTFELRTPGTGPLRSGVLEVRSDLGEASRVRGTEVFELLGSPVSVPFSEPRSGHLVYVSVNESENSGVALYNPHPELWVRVALRLFDNEGALFGVTQHELGPGQQIVGFVNEDRFFGDLLAGRPGGLMGNLEAVVLVGPDVSMLGLLQRADGALIAVETGPLP